MRTLAFTQNFTLDGSIEFLDDWFDPQARGLGDMADLQQEVQRQSAAADGLLTGRRTFEDLRSYWPHREDDTTGTSEYLDNVAKYVVSATLADPGWENSTILAGGDLVQEVRALKAAEGSDIVMTGSITLGHALIENGLVDEVRLFTYPVVQGRGRRLFPDGFRIERLRLLDARPFRSGVALATYALG
jgi:dihydrofolate reductase